jgi:enoyl-CoA hydratase
VNGHAIAGGMILALCGDYRVCTRGEAKLGLTEVRAGMPYPEVAMAIVRAELAPPAARVVALGAELVGPEAALELDLVDELCDPDDVLDRAIEVATGYAALPRAGYAYAKQQLRGDAVRSLRRIVDEGADPLLTKGWVDDESAGAAAAILDRR